MTRYADFYRRSLHERDAFWAEQADLIDWHQPFQQVCDQSQPPFAKWFVGGQLNLCHNAVDRHLPHRAQQAALIAVSSETDSDVVYTFADLHAAAGRSDRIGQTPTGEGLVGEPQFESDAVRARA
jgi:propionyl-CoA synthetase